MSKIKTRETVKNVKVLDKVAVASENMKKAFIRTKDQAQNLADDGQVSSTEYASDQMQYAAEDITQEVGHVAASGIQKVGSKGREAYQHHKAKQAEKAETVSDPAAAPKTKAVEQAKAKAAEQAKVAAETPKSGAYNPAPTSQELRIMDSSNARPISTEMQTYYRGRTHARKSAKQVQETTRRTIKVTQRSERTIKQTAKSTGKASVKTAKGTIKTSKKAVKTAEATSKATIKTTQAALKPPRKRRRRLLRPHRSRHRRREQRQRLLLLQQRP